VQIELLLAVVLVVLVIFAFPAQPARHGHCQPGGADLADRHAAAPCTCWATA
jgi:hypothetical protein